MLAPVEDCIIPDPIRSGAPAVVTYRDPSLLREPESAPETSVDALGNSGWPVHSR